MYQFKKGSTYTLVGTLTNNMHLQDGTPVAIANPAALAARDYAMWRLS